MNRSADLPAAVPADFGALFSDGLLQTRARHPNVADPTQPGGFGLTDGRPLPCPNNSQPSPWPSNVQLVDAENASVVLYQVGLTI